MSTDVLRQTLSTVEMANRLGCTDKALRLLKNQDDSPFIQGRHYRYAGLSTRSKVQWFPVETDEAFTSWQRPGPRSIEAMERD